MHMRTLATAVAGWLAGCRKVLAPFSRPMRTSVAMESRHLHLPTASTCTDQRQVSLSMAYRICTLIDCAHLVQKGIQHRNFAAQPVNGLLVQHVKGTRTSGHDCQPSQTPIPTVSFTYMQTAARKASRATYSCECGLLASSHCLQ